MQKCLKNDYIAHTVSRIYHVFYFRLATYGYCLCKYVPLPERQCQYLEDTSCEKDEEEDCGIGGICVG